jgi:TolB-like protein/tetratricopeptide (TPR) repeat protein
LNSPFSSASELAQGFTLGAWRVEPNKNAIFRASEERHLENRLMQTLVFLAENPGQVISRERFFHSVWQGLVVNEEALSRAISLLRTALGDDARAPTYIQTIPGGGYRLVADVIISQNQQPVVRQGKEFHKNSIAVLPFVNLSEDPANEYFSDGITEEILNVLSQGDAFKVVGRTSSFAFKGKNKDLRKIGKALDVAQVLEGSVRQAGDRVRITAQLIKTSDGFHLWSETFDREFEDVFAIQDEIAGAVVEALKVKLLGKVAEPQVIGGTHSTEAFQAYLQGLHDRNRGSFKETILSAQSAFQQAVTLDPGYARAWANLAFSYCDLLWNSFIEFEEGHSRMLDAASKAIALAPDLAVGHLSMAIWWQLGIPRWQQSLDAINAALKLNPGNAQVVVEYARINLQLGHYENAIAAARRALTMEPISVYVNHLVGHILYFSRRYEEAIPSFRRALALDANYPKPHYFIAMSHHWLGDSETAWEVIQKEPLEWMRNCASAVILHKLGQTQQALDTFARLIEMGVEETNDIQQAGVFAQWDDPDRAIESLNKALDLRDPGVPQLRVDPFMDPLRDDPRFKEILVKAGFKPVQVQ